MTSIDPKYGIVDDFMKFWKKALFEKNGKGLTPHFCQNMNIFKKTSFHLRKMSVTSIHPKYGIVDDFMKFWKKALFEKKGKGLAPHFCQNMNIFKKTSFHLRKMSVTSIHPKYGIVDDFMKFWKKALFEKKRQGVSPSFLPKYEHFHKDLFSSQEDVCDLYWSKIWYCRWFHEILKKGTFWEKWQGVNPSFLPKYEHFQKDLFSSEKDVCDLYSSKIWYCRWFHEILRKRQGVNPSFLPKYEHFQKDLFSSEEDVCDLYSSKIWYCRWFHEILKKGAFWEKRQGVSPSFLPKYEHFQKTSFHLRKMSVTSIDPKYGIVDDFMKFWKKALFEKKRQGVNPSFLPKYEHFQKTSFHLRKMSVTSIDPKYGIVDDFMKFWKKALFEKKGKGLAPHFCQNMNIFKKTSFHLRKMSVTSIHPKYGIVDDFMEFWKKALFEKKGKGLTPHFWYEHFQKDLFSSEEDVCDLYSSKIWYCRWFHEILKKGAFWEKKARG